MSTPSKTRQKPSLTGSLLKAVRGIVRALPVIFTVILLIALIKTYLPAESIVGFFGFSGITDTFIGGFFGSIFAGNSINSYIIGEEMLEKGAPLAAVTAFLASWVIVGIAQLPAESTELGAKFALLRASVGFLFSLIVAAIVTAILAGAAV